MIEEIKNEISTLNIHECDIEDIFEILDKYNNQPDYKSAWNELKGRNEVSKQTRGVKNFVNELDKILKELEQKYQLGGE